MPARADAQDLPLWRLRMSSSPPLTDREYVNGLLVLVAASTTFVGYAGSLYWERTVAPRLFRSRESTLEQEIAKLEGEAEEICTTSNLYEHSRLTRRALRLRQELQAERRKRLTYECSVARVVSTLLGHAAFASEFGRLTGRADAAIPASDRVNKARAVIKQSYLPDSSSTIAPSSPMKTDGAEGPLTASCQRQVLRENAVNILYYNANTTVKYLLRFSSAVVLVCAFGNRRGLIASPPSIEETLRYCAGKAMAPFLRSLVTYLTTTLFAPESGAMLAESHGSGATGSAVGVIRGSIAEATPPASPASLLTTGANSASDAGAAATVQRVDTHVCLSGDLVSWILVCYLAVYLALRVLR